MGSTIESYFDNLVDNRPWETTDKWASTRGKALRIREIYGIDQMAFFNNRPEAPDYEEGKTDYAKWELEAMADELLRDDSKRELCRDCLEEDRELPYGDETGKVKQVPARDKSGKIIKDEDGKIQILDLPQLQCEAGHNWFLGEGKDRSINGKDPVLFAEHMQGRRKREIYTQGGTPDPSIVQGIYNRVHPQGRKVNSPEQRRKNGASFFR